MLSTWRRRLRIRGKDRAAGSLDHDPGFAISVRNINHSHFIHLHLDISFGITHVRARVGQLAVRSDAPRIEGSVDGPNAFISYRRSLSGYPIARRSYIGWRRDARRRLGSL